MAWINLADEAVRIRELQEMLRYLALASGEPAVDVTGTYNGETVRAVRRYQETRHLPVTGVTDQATWESLAEDVRREKERRAPVLIRPIPDSASYVTVPGERGDAVLFLQIVLNALRLSRAYPAVPLTGLYDSRTGEAVRSYQQTAGLEPTGTADRLTWLRLAEEYNEL